MKSSIRISGLAVAMFLLVSTMALAQAPALNSLTGFKTKGELDALVAKLQSGDLKGGQFLFNGAHGMYQVGINHISGKRIPEVQTDKDKFFVVLGGSAIVTVGGELTNPSPKPLDPTEIRGTAIAGGKSQKVSAGDVISVPRGTPHTMDPGEGDITYLLIIMFGQHAEAKKLTINDLPEPVRAKVLAVKGAKVETIKQAAAGYNVDLETKDGKSKEYLFSPEGKVLALEDEIEMASLSPAVQAGLKALAGSHRITKVEAIDLLDLPRYYSATLALENGKTTEVRVALDGGPVKR